MLNVENKNEMKQMSLLMSLFISLGWNSLAWSLRWLYCPVKKTDLVLEVGSGSSPYFRSNVLCDAYMDTGERGFIPLISDRPTVLAYVENLPFKDNSFDFVIASHVLEHSEDPEKFLKELQRVSKAGYIEVPDAFMERLTNYSAHRLEIYEQESTLYIKKKIGPVTDFELVNLFKKSNKTFAFWYKHFPFNFHVRYYWSKKNGGIKYKIINPEYNFDWKYQDSYDYKWNRSLKIKVKQFLLSSFRKIFSQNRRNKQINLFNYLLCIKCHSSNMSKELDCVICKTCGQKYLLNSNGIINFTN